MKGSPVPLFIKELLRPRGAVDFEKRRLDLMHTAVDPFLSFQKEKKELLQDR